MPATITIAPKLNSVGGQCIISFTDQTYSVTTTKVAGNIPYTVYSYIKDTDPTSSWIVLSKNVVAAGNVFDFTLDQVILNSNSFGTKDAICFKYTLQYNILNRISNSEMTPEATLYRIKHIAITTHPANLTVNENQPAIMSVIATGAIDTSCNGVAKSGAVKYQWRKNGVDIVGANSASYTIASSTLADAGNYTVVLSNDYESNVISNVGVLVVNQKVSITTQPTAAITICEGNAINISVVATGTAVNYKWYVDGVEIPSSNTANLSVPWTGGVQAANVVTKVYKVLVYNGFDSVTSSNCTVTINKNVVINTQPTASTTICAGVALSLNVAAAGAGLTYQWVKDNVDIVGATTNTYSKSTPTVADAGTYKVKVTGTCGGVLNSNNAVVTVNSPVTITTNPTGDKLNIGASKTFSVVAAGTELTYQWLKNGAVITGATNASYTIASVVLGDAASYTVKVSGVCGSLTSSAAVLVVNSPIAITTQPSGTTVCSGKSAAFSVVATGAGISYQWKKDGTNISGATSSTYTINPVLDTSGGNYTVVVSNATGSVESNIAKLVVNLLVNITTDPIGETVSTGSSKTFSVTAAGSNLSYQWKKAGANIAGATSSTYTINPVALTDAGVYTVTVTNTCGSATSKAAILAVILCPTITTQPVSQTVCAGVKVTFTVLATGTSLTYQWAKDGVDIAGATTSSYVINSAVEASAGVYTVKVTNGCGTVTSGLTPLTVNSIPTITAQPVSTDTLCTGSAKTFSITTTGVGVKYQWKKSGVNISGATSSTYTIASVTTADAGTYSVDVSTPCKTLTSADSLLIVNTAPAITKQPVGLTTCSGGANSISVDVAGSSPLTYNFRKYSGAVPASVQSGTSNILKFAAIATTDSGDYDVLVSNTCGTVTSNKISLVISQSVRLSDLSPVAIRTGNTVTLTSTLLQGNGVITYAWYKNGTVIAGATGLTYSITNSKTTDSGSYKLVATTTTCGSVETPEVSVLVEDCVVITTPPVGGTCNTKGNVTFTVKATGSNLQYEWFIDNVSVGNNNSTAVLTSSVVGTHKVKVRVYNSVCTSTTTEVNLIVTAPVTIGSVYWVNPNGSNIGTNVDLNVYKRNQATGVVGVCVPIANDIPTEARCLISDGYGPFSFQWYIGTTAYTGVGGSGSGKSVGSTLSCDFSDKSTWAGRSIASNPKRPRLDVVRNNVTCKVTNAAGIVSTIGQTAPLTWTNYTSPPTVNSPQYSFGNFRFNISLSQNSCNNGFECTYILVTRNGAPYDVANAGSYLYQANGVSGDYTIKLWNGTESSNEISLTI